MNKKVIRRITAAACAAMLLSGCQKTPEKPLVQQKKSASQAKTIEASDDMTIAGQVQAPDRYKADLEQPKSLLKVHVDAGFAIPDGKGFKLKKVEGRTFTQEDVDIQMKVLMKNAELSQRVYKEDDPAQGLTRQEAEDQAAYIKALIAMEEGMDAQEKQGMQEIIKEMEEIARVAPETAETEKVEPLLKKLEDQPSEGLTGEGVVDGRKYSFQSINVWEKDWKYVSAGINRAETQDFFEPYNEADGETKDLKENFSREDIEKQAMQLLEAMGMSRFKIAADAALVTGNDAVLSSIGKIERRRGYGLYFTETIDGLPVTYTNEYGGQIDMSKMKSGTDEEIMAEGEGATVAAEEVIDYDALYAAPWPYERLEFVYDEHGLFSFTWENPGTISDLSDEYVFLMPFSDIQAVFEEMIFIKNADQIAADCEYAKIDIHEVRLGYMRILEKGEDGIGTLVPVWDFFGTKEIQYKISDEDKAAIEEKNYWNKGEKPGLVIDNQPHTSIMTINATDGSVIDRSLGY